MFLLVVGLLFTWIKWKNSKPYSYESISYKVDCDNGRTFDPTSKPIRRSYDSYSKSLVFNEDELKSECEHGTVYRFSKSEKNYQLHQITSENTIGSKTDQVKTSISAFTMYYLTLEILRRTFLYVVFGKRVL